MLIAIKLVHHLAHIPKTERQENLLPLSPVTKQTHPPSKPTLPVSGKRFPFQLTNVPTNGKLFFVSTHHVRSVTSVSITIPVNSIRGSSHAWSGDYLSRSWLLVPNVKLVPTVMRSRARAREKPTVEVHGILLLTDSLGMMSILPVSKT